MSLKLLVFLVVIEIVTARIKIDVNIDQDKQVQITYSGGQTDVVADEDVKTFKVDKDNLNEALKQYLGKKPSNVFLKSPTPWGDLYKTYEWEPVKRELKVKSARVISLTKDPIVVLSQDFENSSNQTIKVNTGIQHTIENSITTSWSKQKEFTVSQEFEYDFNVAFAKVSGTTSFSFSTNWGVSEEKTKTETIGTTSGMETDLKPGDAVTAVLSASAGYLDVEIVYKASLRGNLAVNYKRSYRGHHFWGPLIRDVMSSTGIKNEVTTVETIRFGFHVEASLTVYDKKTGLPV